MLRQSQRKPQVHELRVCGQVVGSHKAARLQAGRRSRSLPPVSRASSACGSSAVLVHRVEYGLLRPCSETPRSGCALRGLRGTRQQPGETMELHSPHWFLSSLQGCATSLFLASNRTVPVGGDDFCGPLQGYSVQHDRESRCPTIRYPNGAPFLSHHAL